ncbi:MAG: T9SS type A sorting domain-containing protein [Candidatus Marinimicrobia bacterium]|nr:T9SS type A sorting domain-containing protein [Candidatus Neomarinimicrobiota bacterium]
MKKILLILLVLSVYLFCQEYINVEMLTGNKQDLISNIDKITFDGDNIVFTLKNGGGTTEQLDNIAQITFGSTVTGDQSLPVELTGFTALQKEKDINLYWETAAEVNNQGFDIERNHFASKGWEKIAFVAGEGNSSSPVSYTYCDKNVEKFGNLKYRLKQLDYDGTCEYSPEISIIMKEVIVPIRFTLQNNYPNPFNPTTKIAYEIATEGFVSMKIYNIEGRKIETMVEENQQPGRYELNFDGGSLSSGVYFCRLTSGNNIKIIKMLLVK